LTAKQIQNTNEKARLEKYQKEIEQIEKKNAELKNHCGQQVKKKCSIF